MRTPAGYAAGTNGQAGQGINEADPPGGGTATVGAKSDVVARRPLAAHVDDARLEEELMNDAPRPLRRAVLLMWVGATLSALSALVASTLRDDIRAGLEERGRTHPRERLTAIEVDQATSTMVTVLAVSACVAAVIWLVMAWLNRRGRRWSRIAAPVLALAVALVGVAAAALLWHPENAEHFARSEVSRTTLDARQDRTTV